MKLRRIFPGTVSSISFDGIAGEIVYVIVIASNPDFDHIEHYHPANSNE
jgi:hypothetical protein